LLLVVVGYYWIVPVFFSSHHGFQPDAHKNSIHAYQRRIRLLPYNETILKRFRSFVKSKKLSEQDLQTAEFKLGNSGVRTVLREKGYREVFFSNDWDLLWTGKSQYRFMENGMLQTHQRASNCQGPGGIAGNKINHWNMFKVMQDKFGRSEFNFVPTSYVLPKEDKQLRKAIAHQKEQTWFIAKPSLGRQGKGIFIFRKAEQIPEGKFIVQEYLHRPYLIKSRKFHLRIYLFTRSLSPLRVYLHREGLALFSSDSYKPEEVDNLESHLTNAAVGNKAAPSEEWEADEDDRSHLTWKLSYLYRYLEQEHRVNITKLKHDVAQALVKSVLTIQAQKPFPERTPGTCFDIYGADVMFDEFLNPYVAEINLGPELKVTDSINGRVHKQVINDILDVTEYHPTDRNLPEFNHM
jgi:hypothetical protein